MRTALAVSCTEGLLDRHADPDPELAVVGRDPGEGGYILLVNSRPASTK